MAEADIAAVALPASRIPRTCYTCERVFFRRSSGTSDALKCCSRECGWKWDQARRAAIRPVVFRVLKARCAGCGKPFQPRSGAKYCSPACRRPYYQPSSQAITRRCAVCQSEFDQQTKSGRPTVFCSSACAEQKWTATRRIAKSRRKAKLRLVRTEAVDPIKVLERDGWRCQQCGVRTPKRLRGSYHPRAPEMDHIIPLAKGGEHSYRNTQCLCRTCNIAKSDREQGQLRLFG
jgi:5-methylcytosine-specific restriction endonuclease McrA